MKRLLVTLLALGLVAVPATSFAASTPREVHPGLVMGAPGPSVTLWSWGMGEIATTDRCPNAYISGVAGACDNKALNQFAFPRTVKVTNLRAFVGLAGDSGYTCDANIEIAGVAVGTEMTVPIDTVAGTVLNEAQNFVIAEGNLVGINVVDGTAACPGTVDPKIHFLIEGYYLD